MKPGVSNFIIIYSTNPLQKFGSPYPGAATATRAELPIATSVCSIFVSKTMEWLPMLGFFNMHARYWSMWLYMWTVQTLYDLESTRVCAGPVSGRKMLCHPVESNQHKHYTWLFGMMLYQLSYPTTHEGQGFRKSGVLFCFVQRGGSACYWLGRSLVQSSTDHTSVWQPAYL